MFNKARQKPIFLIFQVKPQVIGLETTVKKYYPWSSECHSPVILQKRHNTKLSYASIREKCNSEETHIFYNCL